MRKVKDEMKKKEVDGKSKFTLAIMHTLQNFYGSAIRTNKGDSEKMSKGILAILFHYKEGPDHSLCPLGPQSWCTYQQDVAKGTSLHLPIENPIPLAVVALLKPIFEKLADKNLLKGCECVSTQNQNESFHHVVWNIAHKESYTSTVENFLAVNLAVGLYNDGYESTMQYIMGLANITITENMVNSWKDIDRKRVYLSDYYHLPKQRGRRKFRRRQKHAKVAAFKHKEGEEHYKTLSFHLNTDNPDSTSVVKKPFKSCGGTSHQRANSKKFPNNKKLKVGHTI